MVEDDYVAPGPAAKRGRIVFGTAQPPAEGRDSEGRDSDGRVAFGFEAHGSS